MAGDQPNVVPSVASVWYYFREQTFDASKEPAARQQAGDAAATMTDTTVKSRILGAAAQQHFNKPIAEAASKNIQAVGLPQWTADEQAFAKAVQKISAPKRKAGRQAGRAHGAEPEPRSGGRTISAMFVAVRPSSSAIRRTSGLPGITGRTPSQWRADRSQSGGVGCESSRDDDARCSSTPASQQAHATTSPTCRQRIRSTSRCSAPAMSKSRVQRGHDGPLPDEIKKLTTPRALRDVLGSSA